MSDREEQVRARLADLCQPFESRRMSDGYMSTFARDTDAIVDSILTEFPHLLEESEAIESLQGELEKATIVAHAGSVLASASQIDRTISAALISSHARRLERIREWAEEEGRTDSTIDYDAGYAAAQAEVREFLDVG